jgi:P4 family phage/plasmid primase-like protien
MDAAVASSHADFDCPFAAFGALAPQMPDPNDDLTDAEWAALNHDPLDDLERWAAFCEWYDKGGLIAVRGPLRNVEAEQQGQQQAAGKVGPSMTDFLKALFENTTGMAYVCSFTNERGAGPERRVITRNAAQVSAFVEKFDKPGRGLFVGVGALEEGSQRRVKETIAETNSLHADIDFKNVYGLGADPRTEALRYLARLKFRPSIIVFSGGGLHAYWGLKEPMPTQGNIERIELALRQLADVVAGDLAVCEVARVMRLPGSHNTKDGAWTEVEVLELNDRRFELDDLEEWLSEQSPVMMRKSREVGKTIGETDDAFNFFEQYAKQFGIKAPIDVEARLKNMMFMGPDDSSIHQTQLAVTAALLNRGVPVDEVVEIVFDATKIAAGDYGKRWNWEREKKKIRGMCETWLKKHPPEEKKPATAQSAKPAKPTLVKSDTRDAAGDKPVTADAVKTTGQVIQMPVITPARGGAPDQHIQIGKAVLAHIESEGEKLISTKDGNWFYSNGVWELRTEPKWLNARIEQVARGFGFKTGNRLISEARGYIERDPDIWRSQDIPWDQHGKIPTRSGLIDPRTGELEVARPDHFCTWRIECDYDPDADCPWWKTYLDDLFLGDERVRKENIRVIQEVLGAALIDKKPRGVSKAFIAQGDSNTGKSGLVDVLGGMFGKENEITVPLDATEGPHWLMPFVKRAPWVLHEAFRPGKWHLAPDVKAIITHNAVNINVKKGPLLRAVVRSPIFWATNYPPQFKETTKAIVNRIIVIKCTRVFEEGAPLIGAAAEARRQGNAEPSDFLLATEMPGILNWGIVGLKRALERGFIELIDSIRATANEIKRDANAVEGFVQDCIEFDPSAMLATSDFCLAFSVWHEEQSGQAGGLGNTQIGKFVSSLGDRRIAIDDELRKNSQRYYGGIAFNRTGLNYWKQGAESSLFDRKKSTTTPLNEEVNRLIPAKWHDNAAVVAMRGHHERIRDKTRDKS